ncbi:MAG: HEAT repeat domain-containing protein [Acidipropionibacterium acidipropionici]|jgi:hypothetical protein|uniref:HEAT repeat domain-containing protein n=1 Tax=Acidipropionibacterium acidipropionici TaxID=1748 RepID=UPI002F358723
MTTNPRNPRTTEQLIRALESTSPSQRLQVAMAAGADPRPGDVPVLIGRAGVDPDFFVRDMLVWALLSHPADVTVPALIAELGSANPEARAQALHALSKVGDPRGWPAVTDEFIASEDVEIARAAWRAAVALVPDGGQEALARRLATQLGRGDRGMRLSLGMALLGLGEASRPVLDEVAAEGGRRARVHARAVLTMLDDPDTAFDDAVEEAKRVYALGE